MKPVKEKEERNQHKQGITHCNCFDEVGDMLHLHNAGSARVEVWVNDGG